VTRFEQEGAGEWALLEMKEAIANKAFSSGFIVMAGHFLLDKGLVAPAIAAAKYAAEKNDSLLPGYVLGMNSAYAEKDIDESLRYALLAAENAIYPWPFYQSLGNLIDTAKMANKDVVRALEKLQSSETENPQWLQTLGIVRYKRQEMQFALEALLKAIDKGLNDIETYRMAATAARYLNQKEKAFEIINDALDQNPDNEELFSYYVYLLSQEKQTFSRARESVPKLIKISRGYFFALYVLGYYEWKDDKIKLATQQISDALNRIPEDELLWNEMHLCAAEVYLELEQTQKALGYLEKIQDKENLFITERIKIQNLKKQLEKKKN